MLQNRLGNSVKNAVESVFAKRSETVFTIMFYSGPSSTIKVNVKNVYEDGLECEQFIHGFPDAKQIFVMWDAIAMIAIEK